MKNIIKKFVFWTLRFLEVNFKLKVRNKTSPIDLYYENLMIESYEFFKDHMKNSSIFLKPKDIRKFAIFKSLENFKDKKNEENLFLEFGVFKGESINFFAKILKKNKTLIYGFDSFEGLEEDWNMNEFNPIGTFSLNKKTPKTEANVVLIKGKVQNTLDSFLNRNNNKKIIFAHLDMDTYKPTKFTLSKIKPFLTKGSVILFDQFYGFPNWQNHEYKAFIEEFGQSKEYKYIAFSESEVAIEILN